MNQTSQGVDPMNSSANNSSVIAKILALTLLLLSLIAQVAAQTREKEQTLENLRDIEVVVKYGRVDGQQEEWQANLLQRLEDRARQRLWEAGVPISQSMDKAGVPGRPRVVFTVTLNRATDNAPPVLVTVQAYQRVRLWRDSAKELELATWTQSGVGGPMVTEKMVLDVFNGEVAEFLKSYSAANPAPSQQVPTKTIADTPARLNDAPNTFDGLNSTGVFVSVREDLFNAQPTGLQKFIQEAAETRLKEAGIKIIRYTNESEQAGHAHLYLWIKLSPPNVQTWDPPIGVESTFSQWIRLVRDPKKHTDAVTWKSQDSGPFAKTDNGSLVVTNEAVLEVVNRQLDEFIQAFKGANSPPQKAANRVPE